MARTAARQRGGRDRASGAKLTRRKAVRDRWLEILGLAFGGATTVAIAAPALLPPSWAYVTGNRLLLPLFVVLLLAIVHGGWGRWPGWSGLRHFAVFPPTWAAALLGYALLEEFWVRSPAAFAAVQLGDPPPVSLASRPCTLRLALWCVATVLVALVFSGATGVWRRRAARSPVAAAGRAGPATPGLPPGDFQELERWLRTDDPIESCEQDAFGHDTVARRIARRLVPDPETGDSPPTIAVVGPLGSGKTSILNLTRHHLGSMGALERSVLLVDVSLWPFEDVAAAVRGILSQITTELSRHVSAASLASLPSRYAAAIAGAGRWWPLLAALLHRERSPEEVLERLETVAAAIDMWIVLWIEDLERFAGTANAGVRGVADDTASANEGLGPIRSLLHLLDQCHRISVILSSNTLDARFDMDKLARFIEHVPPARPPEAAELIDGFRRGCLEMLEAAGAIDPGAEARRPHLHRPAGEDDVDALDSWEPSLAENLATLCATPRGLKQTLRAALDVWEALMGEIDPDDVLMMSTLKIMEPDVFALVERHIDILRDGWGSRGEGQPKKSPFDEALERTLAKRPDERARAVRGILGFLFGDWSQRKTAMSSRPQGLSEHGHADYWRRFLAVPELRDDERDQPLLQAMVGWQNGRTGELPELVADPTRSKAVEDFAVVLSPVALVNLLQKVIERHANERPEEWPGYDSGNAAPTGVAATWRMLKRRDSPSHGRTRIARELERILGTAIEEYTPKNLGLVRSLMRRVELERDASPAVLPGNAIDRLRDKFTGTLSRLTPHEIVETLRGADPLTLSHSIWGLEWLRSEGDPKTVPFPRWEEFAKRLLEALEEEPGVIVPQIVPLLVGQGPGLRERADCLFDLDRLRELLRRNPLPEAQVPETVRERYRTLLEELCPDSG